VAEDLAVMGANLMSGKRRNEVIETAESTVADQLAQVGVAEMLDGLPQGEPHKIYRPDGPPKDWPELLPTAGSAA
jgi:hypothetical protein